ncbi:LysR family transcriptional regulator [Dankookia rubra]|nr:LysR family transcriptional regulator [Dankookia rubra]
MDFRILRRMAHFLAVAEEGHFGRAAARLGLSQPPLSAQIQALEAELGVKLLERTRKGARPTREGEALLPVIRRLAEDAKQVEALARELRTGRQMPMALACVTSALFDFLPPLVRALRDAQPDAAMAVQEMDTADAVEALRRGEVDFALARLDRDRPPLRVLRLGLDALVVALPEGHALLGRPGQPVPPLPLSALAREPLMLLPRSISPAYFDAQVSACREAGFEPVAVREVSSAMAQLAFVAAGLGVALVSSGMAVLRPPGVGFRELAGPVASVGVALVWNAERESEAAKLAVAVAKRVFPHSAGLPAAAG